MFEPRKLIPLSIEFWSAPIAVMTEMTEKTPIAMPVMVRPARNLFAPNEAHDMARTSLKGRFIGILPQRSRRTQSSQGNLLLQIKDPSADSGFQKFNVE